MKKYSAEFISTFILVFCGTGAITIDEVSNGSVGHTGIAITFGLVVMTMIYSVGKVSGAHMNPAVSLIFWLKRELSSADFFKYVISQFGGGLLASIILKLLFPASKYLGASLPAGSELQSFVLELILTFILVFVIFTVIANKENHSLAGLVIGSVVLFEAMFAGPICGASMNPARSLAPAVMSGNIQSLWIYLTAPFLGAVLGWKAAVQITSVR